MKKNKSESKNTSHQNLKYTIPLFITLVVLLFVFIYYPADGNILKKPIKEVATTEATKLVCSDYLQYFAVVNDIGGDTGSDILIIQKSALDQKIDCAYNTTQTYFEIKSGNAEYFTQIVDKYLVTDVGTGPDPRIINVYDLEKKELVFTDQYSQPINISNSQITYFTPTKEIVTVENCQKKDEHKQAGFSSGIEQKVVLDLLTMTKKTLLESRCVPLQ